MISLTSNNQLMLEKSVDFLWAKQQAHLDNISNAETPGYKVKTVTFEEKFAQMLGLHDGHQHGSHILDRKCLMNHGTTHSREFMRQVIQDADWDIWEDTESTEMNENGVNVIGETTEALRTAYQLQYTYQAISKDFNIMNIALQGK